MSPASSCGSRRLSKMSGDYPMLYLGIDVGTAGCKATALDIGGNIRSYAYKDYKAVRTREGYAEIYWDGSAIPSPKRQTVRAYFA